MSTNTQGVLSSLLAEDRPWTVEELVREKGNRLEVVDAIAELDATGAPQSDQQAGCLRVAGGDPRRPLVSVMRRRSSRERRSFGSGAHARQEGKNGACST